MAMKGFYNLIFIAAWISGVVLAQGWLKLVAALFWPYGWYLIAERIMRSQVIIP